MDRIKRGLLLALFSSVAWSFWTVLIDVVDALGKSNYVVYLTIVEVFVLLLNFVLLCFYKPGRSTVPASRLSTVSRYPLYAGVCFGIGNIIFYALVGGSSYPFVASMMFSSVIFLALLLGRVTKQHIGVAYFVGTLVVVLGLILQVFALYGTDIGAAGAIIVYSVLMSLTYAIGYYFAISYAYAGVDPIKSMPYVYLPIIATAVIFGLATGGYANIGAITLEEIAICLVIALSIIIGYLSEEFAFAMLNKAKVKYLNIANILTNLEIVGATVYTAFFLHLSYEWLVAGLLLTFFGIVLIGYSK